MGEWGWGHQHCDTPNGLFDLVHSQSGGLDLTKSQFYTIKAVHISSTSCSEADILHAGPNVFIHNDQQRSLHTTGVFLLPLTELHFREIRKDYKAFFSNNKNLVKPQMKL